MTPAGTLPLFPGVTARIGAVPVPSCPNVTLAVVTYSTEDSPVVSSAGVATYVPFGTFVPGFPVNTTPPDEATASRLVTPCSAVRRSSSAERISGESLAAVLANPRRSSSCAHRAASDSRNATGACASQIKEPSDLSISEGTFASMRFKMFSSVCSCKYIGTSAIRSSPRFLSFPSHPVRS